MSLDGFVEEDADQTKVEEPISVARWLLYLVLVLILLVLLGCCCVYMRNFNRQMKRDIEIYRTEVEIIEAVKARHTTAANHLVFETDFMDFAGPPE